MTSHRLKSSGGQSRRAFLQKTAGAAVALAGGPLLPSAAAEGPAQVAIVLDPLFNSPVVLAAAELMQRLEAHRIAVRMATSLEDTSPRAVTILAAGRSSALAQKVMQASGLPVPQASEAFALVRGQAGQRSVLLVCGADVRGVIYGLLEVADRVEHSKDALAEIRRIDKVVERPANRIRSITRHFSSDVEDNPWFHDRSFWLEYLLMLIKARFNRFSLGFGLGYDAPRGIVDSSFYFAYPFFVAVPGYSVKAVGLPDQQRDANLAMLRWISDQATACGLHFQLALWTHAYEFRQSPKVNYPIAGLTPENHAAYCRDALRLLLEACPSIAGVTFRCHSESGIPPGSYDFWSTVFDGVKRADRKIEIDIHSKGIEPKLLDVALATGMPVNVSPKYWAEHMGLPYHQAAIRPVEWQRSEKARQGDLETQRRFTRYGYADYLREDRKYGVLYRIWPGTQRFLLWADPVFAAGYGRHAHFCGSSGLELCEPLSFKGRKGSGLPGGRDGYLDASLKTPGADWRKHAYGYRVWGRMLYNPDSPPDAFARYLGHEFGEAGADCGAALASASRVLPLVTTAHLPSAANNSFWPEIYTNMPIVEGTGKNPYGDTPSPKRFGTVSPLDPALFSTIEEFVKERGRPKSGKYSPADVARWLDALSKDAESHLAQAEAKISDRSSPAFRRWAVDVRIQAGLGRFFAEKFRAALAYEFFDQTKKEPKFLEAALQCYRAARAAWARLADEVKGVYVSDITYGLVPNMRGHWSDRLAAIDSDIDAMRRKAEAEHNSPTGSSSLTVEEVVKDLIGGAPASRPICRHQPPATLRRGEPLTIELVVEVEKPPQVRLFYRHVNQADEYETLAMRFADGRHRAVIPGWYLQSPYPLLYYFEISRMSKIGHIPLDTWLYPGLNEDLANQPYFVVRREGGAQA